MIENNLYFKAVEESLFRFGSVRIRVKGVSMQPLLRNGVDEVTLTPCKANRLERLDIALFKHRGGYVLHRLIGKEGDLLIFQGDNSLYAKEVCLPSDVLAKVTVIHRPYPLRFGFLFSSPIATYRYSQLRRFLRQLRNLLPH